MPVTMAVFSQVAVTMLLHGEITDAPSFVEIVDVLVVLRPMIFYIKVKVGEPEVWLYILQRQRWVLVGNLGVPQMWNIMIFEPALDDSLAFRCGAVGTSTCAIQQDVGRNLVGVVVVKACYGDGVVGGCVLVDGYKKASVAEFLLYTFKKICLALFYTLVPSGTLAALAALQHKTDKHPMPFMIWVAAMYHDTADRRDYLVNTTIGIFLTLCLASHLQEVGWIELAVAILTAFSLQPILCGVGDGSVLATIGGHFCVRVFKLGGQEVQFGGIIELVHPLEKLVSGHALLHLSSLAYGTLSMGVTAIGAVGYQFARLNGEITVVLAVESHCVARASVVIILEGVVISKLCFEPCAEIVAGLLV